MKNGEKLEIPELNKIKRKVERHTGIPDISLNRRNIEIVIARAIYYKIAIQTTYSLTKIAGVVNRDNAVIFNALSKFNDYMRDYPGFRKAYKDISEDKDDTDAIIEDLKDKIFALEKEIEERKFIGVKPTHRPLLELVNSIPEYHVETVRTRLHPIVKMLEKPSMHNRLPKTA